MGDYQGKPSEIPQEEEEDHGFASESFTCEICIEPTLPSKKFNNTNICKHPFCQECIAKYIEVKIQDHEAKIECPAPSCQYHLDPLICRTVIPESLFSTWCDLLCEDSVLGTKKSYCPNKNCLALVLDECSSRGGNNIVKKCKCPNCKQLFCFQCQTGWHAGYNCEESGGTRDRNDVLFGQLVEAKKWVRCPGCGHCVERREGCAFMRCRCKTQFCYHCGTKVSNNGCGCRHSWSNRMHLQHPLNPQDPLPNPVGICFLVLFAVSCFCLLIFYHRKIED